MKFNFYNLDHPCKQSMHYWSSKFPHQGSYIFLGANFLSLDKTFLKVSTQTFFLLSFYVISMAWKVPCFFQPIIIQNYVICTGFEHFALVLHLNCIALGQSTFFSCILLDNKVLIAFFLMLARRYQFEGSFLYTTCFSEQ